MNATRLLWIAVVVLVVASTPAVYYEIRARMADSSVMTSTPSGRLSVGAAAPDFALPDLTDYPFSVSSSRGSKVVVLEFWATWCGYCRQTLPRLQAMQDELADNGVELVTVNQSEGRARVRDFLASNRYTLRTVLDVTGDIGSLYEVRGLPTLVVVDKQGNVRRILRGSNYDDRQLRKELIALAQAR
jgi:thiol-disulfide isomerase/thioredoxin